jgi:hypothetical protein
MQAVTAANAERVAALVDPRALGFFRAGVQVVELQGGANLAGLIQGLLTDLGEFTTSQQPVTTTIRVVGDTGIVTQTSRREVIVKKKKVTLSLRTTGVYIRSADGWKLLSWHTSDIPLEK